MDDDKMREFVSQFSWREAKTRRQYNPHEYIVVWHKDAKRKDFEEVVKYIRKKGYKVFFGKKLYICYDLDGYRYWTMGDPLNNTWILNRRKKNWKSAIKERVIKEEGLEKWLK